MSLSACTACDAFVPGNLTACPNCDAPARRESWWRRFTSVFRAAGGGAIALTLMACYGAPPHRPDFENHVEQVPADDGAGTEAGEGEGESESEEDGGGE